jgi:hypothetical protein
MYRKFNKYLVLFAVIALLSLTAGIVSAATVTQNMTFQGKLTNAAGNPLTGTYNVTFRIYDASIGGTTLSTDTHSVTAVNGLFTTALAVENPVLIDGRALWLGVKVGSDPEMTPRQEIRPVPYAFSLRPGAVVQKATFITTEGGTSPSNLLSAVNVSTTYIYNPGIRITTTGVNSEGVSVKTQNADSEGMYVVTEGEYSEGLYAVTHGDGSEAVYSVTDGEDSEGVSVHTSGINSEGVYAFTKGANSEGVYAVTEGDASYGLYAATYGKESEGVYASTHGLDSEGVYVTTEGDSSDGVFATTDGSNSRGLYAGTSGERSYGVYAVTTGYDSEGVKVVTFQNESQGVYVTTDGEFSDGVLSGTHGDRADGVNIYTYGNSSEGIDAKTWGMNSDGVLVHTRGRYSEGVLALTEGEYAYGIRADSNQSYGIYATTGRDDNKYGIYTPDYLYARGAQVPATDVAEYMPVTGDAGPGTVLIIGNSGGLEPASAAYDTRVAGIVSTEPGVTLGTREDGNPGEEIIAVAGRVPCKVDAGYGAIRPGDLLATSDTPGHAMKAADPQIGTVLGKAMGTLTSGTGTIDVLVTLQ